MKEVTLNKQEKATWIDKIIRFCLEQKLIVFLLTAVILLWGIAIAPFDWDTGSLPRDPIPVDAIPDISDNLQIVFTDWSGNSPQDVEDQVTYPLTTALLGIPGVKVVRSYSLFGFSTISIIFQDDIDFYWSRSRILEKLNSLPANTLPSGVQPTLGPDATALGQVYWYTLEGRDKNGNPTGGWDPEELRTWQDWYIRYWLLSAEGVSDVASIGGFVKTYQIDVNPDALRAYEIDIQDVFSAVKMSNLDVGARTIEVNQVEYVIRGIGFVKNLEDIENAVIKVHNGLPILVKDIAWVTYGPFERRGALDKEGAGATGGVVIGRYGENTLEVLKNVHNKIAEISPGLPSKVLDDGTESTLTIVPFYDRTELIKETLFTLDSAILEEIVTTIIVILLCVMNFRSSLLISAVLPIAVLLTFIAMKVFHVEANIVSLSGIAIGIGAMVAMGIIICENILKYLEKPPEGLNRLELVYQATREVGSAVITAAATTIVSFLPVFSMIGPEGRLFRPLAFTKTFALASAMLVSIVILPAVAHLIFFNKKEYLNKPKPIRIILFSLLVLAGIFTGVLIKWWLGTLLLILAIYSLIIDKTSEKVRLLIYRISHWLIVFLVTLILTNHWLPLGPERGFIRNFIFIAVVIGVIVFSLILFQKHYHKILKWCLKHKFLALSFPAVVMLMGFISWIGIPTLSDWMPRSLRDTTTIRSLASTFPGFGKEFMPPLDEGSFLFMPVTMPHAGTEEVTDILKTQNILINDIPEIKGVVGKWGRAETPLDPAPISMFETTINYKSKYYQNEKTQTLRFKYDSKGIDYFRAFDGEPLPAPDGQPYKVQGKFIRDKNNRLIPDSRGVPFLQWRPALSPKLNPGRKAWKGIKNNNEIWDEIVQATTMPGVTTAPKLAPIAARIVMLQSGMRAPMGIKIQGPDLETIEAVGIEMERLVKQVPSVIPEAVIADRIIGKPYLEIEIDREQVARYGLMINEVQKIIEVAIGGVKTTTSVEGRERYPIRVRYMRELRDSLDEMQKVLVSSIGSEQVPLSQVASIRYVRGPQQIKSENTFLVGYLLFDKLPGFAEVDVVEDVQKYLQQKIMSGELKLPKGVTYTFSGSYENEVRAKEKLSVILPVALVIIFLILYFQFRTVSTSLIVFSGIFITWSGGFLLMWFYSQPWFLNFSIFSVSMRELFQIHPINLSVAVWVGFLVLFGMATDDGVLMSTYIRDKCKENKPESSEAIHNAVLEGAAKRIRPALMTTATTFLALLPVLTATGRGSDIMIPMAIPSFGGMIVSLFNVIVVPVLYCIILETKLKFNTRYLKGNG